MDVGKLARVWCFFSPPLPSPPLRVQVQLKKTDRIYAMKVIKKELVMDEEDIDWVQTEKHVFEQASNHPFLVGLHSCFQTSSRWAGQGVEWGEWWVGQGVG